MLPAVFRDTPTSSASWVWDSPFSARATFSRFFRISLSKGKSIIPVKDELEHVRNYLLIQNMRYKNKFRYTIDCVTLAKETGCRLFVGAGSQAEWGPTAEILRADLPVNPQTGYGIAKFAAGKLSRLYADSLGMTHIWVRILSVFGVGSIPNSIIPSSIDKYLKCEHAAFTKGEQIWDFLYCDDAALAFYLIGCKAKESKIYPLASGETRTLAQYITAMRDTAAPNAPLFIGELPYPPGQVMRLQADLSELYADTGFAPAVGFEEGIRRTAAWRRSVLGLPDA